jgi:hypothetical protein
LIRIGLLPKIESRTARPAHHRTANQNLERKRSEATTLKQGNKAWFWVLKQPRKRMETKKYHAGKQYYFNSFPKQKASLFLRKIKL